MGVKQVAQVRAQPRQAQDRTFQKSTMLHTAPTRLPLRHDDLSELEEMRQEWAKDPNFAQKRNEKTKEERLGFPSRATTNGTTTQSIGADARK
jgi:flagellar biosynthesis GTPase FlhF